MRHVPSDKYTIAWFKLAECIARGEREKAYGVYKLLSHSLSDVAYAYQLEGDLLRCFEDARAYEKYNQALKLYYEEKRWHEAAGIGEHLKMLGFLSALQREMLTVIHQQLGNTHYQAQLLLELALSYVEEQKYEPVLECFERALAMVDTLTIITHGKKILFAGIAQDVPLSIIKTWLQFFIKFFVQSGDVAVTAFMSELAIISPSYHHIAQQMIEKR